jgi:iron complex outermembrane receptor protein
MLLKNTLFEKRHSVMFIALMAAQPFVNASVLEEVIVTAQKREQNIQDVPIAITAFTGEAIRKLGMSESIQIITMTPGVSRSGSSGEQTAQFSIRGVTQNDFADHVEAPTAVYVDEGYVGFSQAQVFGMFDLNRVEVLKGPQGTLFGRNATGGLVQFISNKPTEEFEAYADLSYGSYDSLRFEGAVGGGITDSVSGRLSLFYNKFDPILDNNFPEGLPEGMQGSAAGASDFYSDDQIAGRAQVLWNINDSAEFLVSVFASEKNPSSGNFQSLATSAVVNEAGAQVGAILAEKDSKSCMSISSSTGECIGGTRPVNGGDYFGWKDPDGAGEKTSTDYASTDFNKYETDGVTAKLSWDFDQFLMTSVTHYMHSTKRQALDTDSGPAPATIVMNDSENDTFSQEIRFTGDVGGINWVAGVYYLYLDTEYNQGLADTEGGINIFGSPPGAPPMEGDFTAVLETNSYSVFGQFDIPLSERLSFTIGGRAIQEEKDYNYTSYFFVNTNDETVDNNVAPLGPFLPAFSDDSSDTLWAGKLQLEYRPSEDSLIYGGISRGVKAGSFNAPLLDALTPEQYSYDEEKLISYEAGFKVTLPAGNTRINGSIYYYDYNDYQAFTFSGLTGAIFNHDATSKGAELEIYTFPTEQLSFVFGAAYINAEIPDLAVAPDVYRDVRPAFTPERQFNALGIYEFPVDLVSGNVSFQIDGSYTSSFYQTIKNFDAQETDAYFIGNARLSWLNSSGSLELAAYVKNFTDEENKVTAIDLSGLCGCTEQAYGMPKTYGLQARYNF